MMMTQVLYRGRPATRAGEFRRLLPVFGGVRA
jgi:hypothetical protein